MRHDDEFLGRDVAGHDLEAELRVGFGFEVLVEGADFGFVGAFIFGAVGFVHCGFDGDGHA